MPTTTITPNTPITACPAVTSSYGAWQGTASKAQGVATGSVADADLFLIGKPISDRAAGNFATVFKALERGGSHAPKGDTLAIVSAFAAAEAAVAAIAALKMAAAQTAAGLLLAQEADAVARAALTVAVATGDPAATELAKQAGADAAALLERAACANQQALVTLLGDQIAAAQAATDAANLPLQLGLDISPNGSITVLNQSTDIGLSPTFYGWMAMFGQFFGHGLKLIPQCGNGPAYIALHPDDPLYLDGGPNFMAQTRAASFTADGADCEMGMADDQANETPATTAPLLDPKQTPTSNASHPGFMREYRWVDNKPAGTGQGLDGSNSARAPWAATPAADPLPPADTHEPALLATPSLAASCGSMATANRRLRSRSKPPATGLAAPELVPQTWLGRRADPMRPVSPQNRPPLASRSKRITT